MSEEAAQAKRLFDNERWPEAVNALGRVASGETGDDAGNRELAQYYRLLALVKSGRSDEAVEAVFQIAPRAQHLKHVETALWIARLAHDQPAVVHALGKYQPSVLDRFSSPAQAETRDALTFLLGRQRFEVGARAEATAMFEKVPAGSRFHTLAVECAKLAR